MSTCFSYIIIITSKLQSGTNENIVELKLIFFKPKISKYNQENNKVPIKNSEIHELILSNELIQNPV